MNLKKATLLALIGSILMLISAVLWTTDMYKHINNTIIHALDLVGTIFIVIFFYSLYKYRKYFNDFILF